MSRVIKTTETYIKWCLNQIFELSTWWSPSCFATYRERLSNTTLLPDFSRYSSIMAPKMFEVSFKENYAILSMKCGENRLNPKFLEDFHCALDKIERYLILFSWGCGVWSVKSWKYVGVWLLFLLYEGNVARLDSRMLDHLFASRWQHKRCKHFLFSVI